MAFTLDLSSCSCRGAAVGTRHTDPNWVATAELVHKFGATSAAGSSKLYAFGVERHLTSRAVDQRKEQDDTSAGHLGTLHDLRMYSVLRSECTISDTCSELLVSLRDRQATGSMLNAYLLRASGSYTAARAGVVSWWLRLLCLNAISSDFSLRLLRRTTACLRLNPSVTSRAQSVTRAVP